MVVCFQCELDPIHRLMESFTCPNESECFLLSLRVAALNILQATACIINHSLFAILDLLENCTESYWTCISHDTPLRFFIKVCKTVRLCEVSFQMFEGFFFVLFAI